MIMKQQPSPPKGVTLEKWLDVSMRLEKGICDHVWGGAQGLQETLDTTTLIKHCEYWVLAVCGYDKPHTFAGVAGMTAHGLARNVIEQTSYAYEVIRSIGPHEVPPLPEGDESGAGYLIEWLKMERGKLAGGIGEEIPDQELVNGNFKDTIDAVIRSAMVAGENLNARGMKKKIADEIGCDPSYVSARYKIIQAEGCDDDELYVNSRI